MTRTENRLAAFDAAINEMGRNCQIIRFHGGPGLDGGMLCLRALSDVFEALLDGSMDASDCPAPQEVINRPGLFVRA